MTTDTIPANVTLAHDPSQPPCHIPAPPTIPAELVTQHTLAMDVRASTALKAIACDAIRHWVVAYRKATGKTPAGWQFAILAELLYLASCAIDDTPPLARQRKRAFAVFSAACSYLMAVRDSTAKAQIAKAPLWTDVAADYRSRARRRRTP